ncbi:MAG: YggS family pyridoxal phosphate-dependent enzyme [Bacteroidota bacterium]
MSNIVANFKSVRNNIPGKVKLIVISKTKPTDDIMQVYRCGHRLFGESKVQELIPKYEELPKDIQWHIVGHLQRNKVKYIAPFISMIHSVDSLKLLKEINKEAEKSKRTIDCLLQIHIAKEETKFGMDNAELNELLSSQVFKNFKNVKICGLMGMATFTENTKQIRKEFNELHNLFISIKERYFSQDNSFKEISMGMTDDYEIAVECGTTMVRVGSAIFGKR